jgi:hypothetical protein
MRSKFIIKHIDSRKPQVKIHFNTNVENTVKENKKKENEIVMTTSEKIEMAKSILNTQEMPQASVKRVKKEKGLIERTESSKTILTEDNKELLND